MTTSPKEIAELLARKCSYELTKEWNIGNSSLFCDDAPEWDAATNDDIKDKILQSIPLVELLECVSELKYQVAQHNRSYRATSLEFLTTKLKALGIE